MPYGGSPLSDLKCGGGTLSRGWGLFATDMGSIDLSSVLNAWYSAKAGVPSSGATTSGSTAGAATAPTPPWTNAATSSSTKTASGIPPQASALMNSLSAGGKLINPSAAKLSGVGQDANATSNYRSLFALYQGLTNLQLISQAATSKTLTAGQTNQLQQAFQTGMQQVQTYLGTQPFKGFEVYQTAPAVSATTTTTVPKETDTYTTQPLYKGGPNGVVPAFQGPVQFSVTATKTSGAHVTVAFDLSDLGDQPRTFGNVLNYMNDKMSAAGLETRFGDTYTAGKATTVQAGSKTITLAPGPDQYALKVIGTSVESLSFAAPAADPGVYVAQSSGIVSGDDADAVQQLVKFDASATPADALAVNSQVFNNALSSSVSKVVATASGPDGSVYVLANITGSINGQAIQGAQDVALIKYDSAGNVAFTRTLGADTTASATGLAVSADGSQVAIVGTSPDNLGATTTTTTAATSVTSATPPQQGFVTVYNGDGDEQWTQQTQAVGGTGDGVQPSSVAFGAGGMVYVAGQVDGHILGAGAASGGLDAYVQGFHAVSRPLNDGSGLSQWVVSPTATAQYGTTGQDHATGVAVSGSSIYVSSLENGDAVVRRFDASGSAGTGLTQSAVQDLGSVQGGGVAGVAIAADGSVIVAGTTHNGALGSGTVTQAYSSGQEAFVARLSADLSPSNDVLTYLGGPGDQSATAVTVSGGKVYVAGQVATAPLPGSDVSKAWNGYVTALDPATGQVSWSNTYSGKENEAAPAGIAVVQGGASVLDQLGLPASIDFTPSQSLVSNTSLRPGDEFFVQSGTGTPVAVSIAAGDTYQTLGAKIAKASNFSVKAVVVPGTAGSTLKLTPSYANVQVNLLPGPSGRNALTALGLAQGVLSTTAAKESSAAPSGAAGPASDRNSLKNGYSLNLASTLNLTNPARATAATAALSSAMAKLKGIYSDMVTQPSTTAAKAAITGTVPTYLTNEIAQYQAALARLSS